MSSKDSIPARARKTPRVMHTHLAVAMALVFAAVVKKCVVRRLVVFMDHFSLQGAHVKPGGRALSLGTQFA